MKAWFVAIDSILSSICKALAVFFDCWLISSSNCMNASELEILRYILCEESVVFFGFHFIKVSGFIGECHNVR